MREKIKQLLDIVTIEISKAEKSAQLTKEEADSISRAAPASPSASGDRFHAEQQALMNEEYLLNLHTLKNDLDQEMTLSLPEYVRPICYIKVLMEGNEKEMYLVSSPVKISVNLVSANSPMGSALFGKKVGEDFEFGEEIKVRGKLLEIG